MPGSVIADDNRQMGSLVSRLQSREELTWVNPQLKPTEEAMKRIPLNRGDVDDAEARLRRFAPFLMRCFPEIKADGGLIESPLTEIPGMRDWLHLHEHGDFPGRLFLKRDSDLAIAGSVKARGGIYEVLKHSEDLVKAAGLLREDGDYAVLASGEAQRLFSQYTVQVSSTGNLGLSIGIMSAVLGYRVRVHMSADARQWKKDLLRAKGVDVVEYAGNYGKALEEGRRLSESDPKSYFVDDENSRTLFLGYAVAARRLKKQLREQKVSVDREHPLIVCIPCGVGGAPGGICFGLKQEFGDDVHVFFSEPTEAPCMLLGLATGRHDAVCVQDIGLSGRTHADGLAVSRPSRFVGKTIAELISGEFSVSDARLFEHLRALLDTEKLFIEPSSCAAFTGISRFGDLEEYFRTHGLENSLPNAAYIAWATGGRLVPPSEREKFRNTFPG